MATDTPGADWVQYLHAAGSGLLTKIEIMFDLLIIQFGQVN